MLLFTYPHVSPTPLTARLIEKPVPIVPALHVPALKNKQTPPTPQKNILQNKKISVVMNLLFGRFWVYSCVDLSFVHCMKNIMKGRTANKLHVILIKIYCGLFLKQV